MSITESGHYAIPFNNSGNILKKMESRSKIKINLIAQPGLDKKKMAKKLHTQFGHPPMKKLLKLIERAGLANDKELVYEVGEVHKGCSICKEFTNSLQPQ